MSKEIHLTESERNINYRYRNNPTSQLSEREERPVDLVDEMKQIRQRPAWLENELVSLGVQ
jgi:hypothetical protein